MDIFRCPECGVERPEEIHYEYCRYDGPDFGPNGEDPDEDNEWEEMEDADGDNR